MIFWLTCPQGHQWDVSLAGPVSENPTASPCPVCGALSISARADDLTSAEPLPEDLTATVGGCPASAPGGSDLPRVPGYQLLERLGRGGMGVVFKARHLRLGRLVALKLLLSGSQASPQQLARFHLEAEALASLHHPNIVQIFDIGEHNGWPYLALELVEGGSLDNFLAGRPQPPEQAAQLVETLARAMHAVHQRGVIHRDLKPANILLAPGSPAALVPKITDFGLAKRLTGDPEATLPGTILGTPRYMAPEQIDGIPSKIGPLADVYALGIILYETLTGLLPYSGNTPWDILQRMRTQEPLPPSRVRPRLPRDLERICLKCLQQDPARRYQSAEALAEDLRRFRDGEPIRARPVGRMERLVKWVRRRPAWAALILVGTLSATVVLTGSLRYNMQLRAERDRAEWNLQMAHDAIDGLLTEIAEEKQVHQPHLLARRRETLKNALDWHQKVLQNRRDDPDNPRKVGLAYLRLADLLRQLGQNEEALAAFGEAISRLTSLTQNNRGDQRLLHELATGCNYQGEVLRSLSRLEEARRAYNRSREILEQLLQAEPDQPAVEADLARSHYNLGILNKESSDPKGALDHLNQAVALLEQLVVRFPEPDWKQHLARAYLNQISIFRYRRQLDKAGAVSEKAIDLLGQLHRQMPYRPDYSYELAVCYNNRGNVRSQQEQFTHCASLVGQVGGQPHLCQVIGWRAAMLLSTPAEQDFREAQRLLRKVADDFPENPDYRVELANTSNSLTAVLLARDWQATRETLLGVRDLCQQLVKQYPEMVSFQGKLGMVLGNLGYLELQQENWGRARDFLEQGIDHLLAVLKANPDHPYFGQTLRQHLNSLAFVLIQQGNHQAAIRRAANLPGCLLPSEQGFDQALCFLDCCCKPRPTTLASAVGLAGGLPHLWPGAWTADFLLYFDQACVILRQTQARGINGLKCCQADTDLQRLRQHKPFLDLLQAAPKGP